MLEKLGNASFFQCFVCRVNRKEGSLKRRVRSHVGGEKHISKSNVKRLTVSEHFFKFRCLKIARRGDEKHISKSKCKKLRASEH